MVENYLDTIPNDRPVALVLRHAERPDIPINSVGADLCLTEAGVQTSRRLGALMVDRVLSVNSSPILRCRQTAQSIIDSSLCSVPIANSSLLGDPGVFVVDGDIAFQNWSELGNMGVIRHLSTSDNVLPGMRSADEAVSLMLDWLSKFLWGKSGLHLFVTHDAILVPFASQMIGGYDEDNHYSDYLDGLAIWPDQEGSFDFMYKGFIYKRRIC